MDKGVYFRFGTQQILDSASMRMKNKKAQLMLAYPRDAKTMKKILHFEVITSSSQVGNPVFIVIKCLIQITSTYNNS